MKYAKCILVLLTTFLMSNTVLASENTETTTRALDILNHECSRVEKYLEHNSLDDKLGLLYKEADEGIKLSDEFNLNNISEIQAYYYNRDEYKGRRYFDIFQSANGNLYGLHSNGNIVVNGRYSNKVYDENGNLLNIPSLMYAKYKDKMSDSSDYIYFDSIDDKNSFLLFLQTVYGLRQQEYYDVEWKNGKIGIQKAAILRVIGHSESDDKQFKEEVDRLTDIVKNYKFDTLIDNALYAAIGYVLNSEYIWDGDYLCTDSLMCIKNKKVVCYHFSKLAAGILENYGYNYTYEFGTLLGGQHVWLLVENKHQPGYTRFDPTTQKYYTAYGFLDIYKIRGITNDN